MKKYFSHYILSGCTVGLSLTAPALHAQLNTAVTPYANRTLFQAAATNAGAPATNVVDFERNLPSGTGTGFVPTFTEAGFVTFNTGSAYSQEVIDGRNVGQGDNDLYTVLSVNKAAITADITFATGVLALGFDFKNTSNGPTSAGLIAQSFTFTLFSGTTNLGNYASTTVPNGASFQFLGFTSSIPITEMTIIATVPGMSPNLDIVLDNFAVSSPVPEPGVTASIVLGLVGLVAGRRFIRQRRQA